MESEWAFLDSFIIDKIFLQLSFADRFSASLVCRRWSESFKSAKVWHQLTFDDGCFSNNQDSLDYDRIRSYLTHVGHYIKRISIETKYHFNALYQFLVLLHWFIDSKSSDDIKIENRIQRISFVYPCNTSYSVDRNGIKLFGIGGTIVTALKNLLSNLQNLKELILEDMVLERFEANRLLDHISIPLSSKITNLMLTNLTLTHCSLSQIDMFRNLEILQISPQNIDDSMLISISCSNLKHLVIIQNKNTPKSIMPCSAHAWTTFQKRSNCNIRVHLYVLTNNCELLIQPMAPVYSIICHNRSWKKTDEIIQNYKKTISMYSIRSTTNSDKDIIYLVMNCNLVTIMIWAPVMTATLLIISKIGKMLKKLYVRKSTAVERCEDWLKDICIRVNLNYDDIEKSSQSIEKTVQEICENDIICVVDDLEFKQNSEIMKINKTSLS